MEKKTEPPTDVSATAIIPGNQIYDSNNGGTDDTIFTDAGTPDPGDRYQILSVIGQGGFGIVYRALDTQLKRHVAFKVPHADRVTERANLSMYLEEARTLASLSHPGIVKVFDFGVLSDGRCFVVSELIEGETVRHLIANGPVSWEVAIPLLIAVADALNYVHTRKLIHRDIKPGNILLNENGQAILADFGLAMHETRAGSHRAGEGTLNYMSPEQVSEEGHRIDCRSDLFSLGAVMYELLTGNKPFRDADAPLTIRKIIQEDPDPITLLSPSVSTELNRICLKLLSKRATDRYQTGQELLEDLLHFQQEYLTPEIQTPRSDRQAEEETEPPALVVPRGLRSFEGQHAYFFLQLLPGPFDREGLPEILSHWVRWVQRGIDKPELHRIGVIAGPSGCGKSSLVKAGLIPLLTSRSIRTLMIEASIDQTEDDLAKALDSQFPELMAEGTLTQKIAAIRRGHGLPSSQELLIVIDQFEQWLHAHPEEELSDLARALRQCDGRRVQCILLVRDDFWLALNRLMATLEAPLIQGENVSLVDLFRPSHARDVLTKFGRSFGRIPHQGPLNTHAQQFIKQAVEFVARDGKVYPVHLSLFADMVKDREWIPDTLQELGGAAGVGLLFLREAFSTPQSPARQRIHEAAARRVLESLLPDPRTNIKTKSQTRSELLKVSGYENEPLQFDSLMRLLEGELKLISPIDTLDRTLTREQQRGGEARYQLSHDFLVPSIREWLFSEQRKTVRGRSRMLLSELAAVWTREPTRRNMPLWNDWVAFRALLSPRELKDSERRFLRAADKYQGIWTVIVSLAIFAVGWGIASYRNVEAARSLTEQLRTADLPIVPFVVGQLTDRGRYGNEAVNKALAQIDPGTPDELKLRLAQARWDPKAVDRLIELGLSGGEEEVQALLLIRDTLYPNRNRCLEDCWKVVDSVEEFDSADLQNHRAFRSLLLLAKLDPPESDETQKRWGSIAPFLSKYILHWIPSHPEQFLDLVKAVRPIAPIIVSQLDHAPFLGDSHETDHGRWAALFLNELVEDPLQRSLIVADAIPWQWEYMPTLADSHIDSFRKILQDPTLGDSTKSSLSANRLATAAAIVLAQDANFDRWDLLKRGDDEDTRSLLIHRIPMTGVPMRRIEDRLARETDPGILSALVMTIGEYPQATSLVQSSTKQKIAELWKSHPDAEVHAACQWAARLLDIPHDLKQIQAREFSFAPDRQWRVTPEGHQFIRIDARNIPGINRIYEISAMEVTIEQFEQFLPEVGCDRKFGPLPDNPANLIKWHTAMRYCDYLSQQHGITADQLFIPAKFHNAALFEKPFNNKKDHEILKEFLPMQDDFQRTGYRLPTVEEWIYACMAGSKHKWSFGTHVELMTKYAIVDETHSNIADPLLRYSCPGGYVKPNRFGLFDTLGNMLEWTASCQPEDEQTRIVMGGSYVDYAAELDGHATNNAPMDEGWYRLGFRIARTIPE